MSLVALIAFVMLVLGAMAKAFPSVARDSIIIVLFGVGIILLLPAPVFAYAIMFQDAELEAWLKSIGVMKMIMWGIPVVFVGSFFMQAWLSENAPPEG